MRRPSQFHSEIAGSFGPALAGLGATLVGIGFARFGYAALIPGLVEEGWFGGAQPAYLGAANFAGYLAGALAADKIARRISSAALLRAMMLAASFSFLACAAPLPFEWFFLWRFAAGFAGGVLTVLAPSAILLRVPAARRGAVGGVIFSGVGIGIVASSILVPLFMRLGLPQAWLALGGLSLLLTVGVWRWWPAEALPGPAPRPVDLSRAPLSLPLKGLCLAYGVMALGFVPHFIFLVDFVARGLGRGLDAGAQVWATFGAGALLGPIAAGTLADRIGFARALRLGILLLSAAIAWTAMTSAAWAIALASLLVGALTPGIVPLVLGRARELATGADHRRAWGLCTSAFALGQAAAGYGFSYLFDATGGSYRLLFAIAAAAMAVALAVEVAASCLRRERGAGPEILNRPSRRGGSDEAVL
jgi:predicted MFS family arabinose efflux permease